MAHTSFAMPTGVALVRVFLLVLKRLFCHAMPPHTRIPGPYSSRPGCPFVLVRFATVESESNRWGQSNKKKEKTEECITIMAQS